MRDDQPLFIAGMWPVCLTPTVGEIAGRYTMMIGAALWSKLTLAPLPPTHSAR
jgi:hypothetical protein